MDPKMPNAETTTVEVKIPVAGSAVLGDQTHLMEILSLGLEEYRLRQAMTLYRTGDVSLAYAAEQVGLPVRLVQEKARQRGLLPRSDDTQFDQDRNRFALEEQFQRADIAWASESIRVGAEGPLVENL
jgi:predicted HTH domain antitoxin